jgi:hypothetical protein
MVLSFLCRSAVAQGVGCCSAAVVALGVCSCSAALERSGVFAERSSVQLGSGSSGSGCRIGCGRGGSGRTLQRAAGQRHRRQWHTTIKRDEGRTLQRAAGQRHKWKRLSHLLWQRWQWQNAAACSGAAVA